MRLKREQKERDKETLPDKAGPFHNANHKKELEKIDRQSKVNEDKKQQPENNKTLDIKENGRPPFSTDEGPRKKRVETPKSTPGLADLIVWSNDAFEQVSATLNKAFLGHSNKKNLRQLTKAEVCNLEDLKIQVLSNLEPMCEISDDTIFKAVSCKDRTPNSLTKKLKEQKVSASELPINSYKKKLIGVFVEHFFDVL